MKKAKILFREYIYCQYHLLCVTFFYRLNPFNFLYSWTYIITSGVECLNNRSKTDAHAKTYVLKYMLDIDIEILLNI